MSTGAIPAPVAAHSLIGFSHVYEPNAFNAYVSQGVNLLWPRYFNSQIDPESLSFVPPPSPHQLRPLFTTCTRIEGPVTGRSSSEVISSTIF